MVSGLGIEGNWIGIKDGDPRGIELFKRHYSARSYRDNRRRTLFVGPGEKMVLLTVTNDALFVWRKFISDDGQEGVNCSIFRNEGPVLSSELIREAEELAWGRWPDERLFTYVWDTKVESVNPGYCFKMAGWNVCGRTKVNDLTILEKLPMRG